MDGLSGKRVEHNIDTLTVGEFHDLIGKLQASGIQYMVRPYTKTFHVGFFLRAANRSIDFSTCCLGNMNGSDSDPSCSSMDQDLLTLSNAAQINKRIIGGCVNHRQGGCILKTDISWLLNHMTGLWIGKFTQAGGRCGHNLITHLQMLNIFPKGANDPGTLQSHGLSKKSAADGIL